MPAGARVGAVRDTEAVGKPSGAWRLGRTGQDWILGVGKSAFYFSANAAFGSKVEIEVEVGNLESDQGSKSLAAMVVMSQS